MDNCKGNWVGGGLIHLFEPDEFKKDDNLLEPIGFEEGQREDWNEPASRGRFYMHETI